MEDTEAPCPTQPFEFSITELIARLEKQILEKMDTTLTQLQASQKESSVETSSFKTGIQKVFNHAQASLIIRTIPSLLDLPLSKGSLQTDDLLQKVHQTTETIKELCRDQVRQTLAAKVSKLLELIQAKEDQIKDQITHKQKAIEQLVRDKTTLAN